MKILSFIIIMKLTNALNLQISTLNDKNKEIIIYNDNILNPILNSSTHVSSICHPSPTLEEKP